jgi:hypothetical protein
MSQITFDQPSTGNVNSAADALAVVNQGSGNAVTGNSRQSAVGVSGSSEGGVGVRGESQKVRIDEDGNYAIVNDGVFGLGKNGVHGQSASPTDSGVWGENTGAGYGVAGSTNSPNAAGVWGDNQGAGNGVRGTSVGGDAIWGNTTGQGKSGVLGTSQNGLGVTAISDTDTGLWAKGQNLAGYFEGNVMITGNLNMTSPTSDITLSDCAEDFDVSVAEQTEPGTVMVLDNDGLLRESRQAYDKRVAGVISGAGDFRPGIILGKQQSQNNRMPIALLGKAYCKVDAQYSPVEVGDLLTTSPTPGHAMKAGDPLNAFGSVIGKALRRLQSGQDLVPILIALQ